MSHRIAVVIDPWDYPFNGTVVSTRRFVQALEDSFEFRLLSTPDTARASDPRMVKFSKVSIPGFNSVINAMKVPLARPNKIRLRQALQDCSVLHVQFPFFLGFSAIREAKKLGLPIICSFHVQPENLLLNIGLRSTLLTRALYKMFIHFFYNQADLVIAPSEFAAQALLSKGLVRPVRVLSNGVPEQYLSLQHSDAVKANGKFRLLSVGRLAREKQHRVIFEAIDNSQYRNEIELVVVGTGPLEQELIDLVKALGINASIGSVSDEQLLEHYRHADLFVHAGDIELEGMSVVEAMASGNAVVVSDSKDSATSSLVENLNAQFKHGDAIDLADRIDYWLSHETERLQMAENNRAWARKRTHSVSVRQLANIYDELAASGTLAVGAIDVGAPIEGAKASNKSD